MKIRVFEMVGLPGAGKSTIAMRLESALPDSWRLVLRKQTREVFQMPPPGFYRNIGAIGRLLLAQLTQPARINAIRQGINPAQDSVRMKLRRVALFSEMLHYSDKLAEADHETEQLWFVEENLVQAMIALGLPAAQNTHDAKIHLLAEHVLASHVYGLIIVDCDLETALTRIRSRGSMKSRFDTWDDETVWVNLQVMQRSIDVVEHSFRNAKRPVLRVSSLQPPEGAVAEVSGFLEAGKQQ